MKRLKQRELFGRYSGMTYEEWKQVIEEEHTIRNEKEKSEEKSQQYGSKESKYVYGSRSE